MSARTYFLLKQKALPNDRQKIIWTLQFFVGNAEPWARGKLGLFHNPNRGDPYPDYAAFETDARVVFGAMNRATEARNNVFSICQKEGETIGQFLHRFRPEADASEMSDAALIHRLRQCLPATIQTSVAVLRGGAAPERIAEWYEALHLIDQSQVTSAAILNSVPAASRPLQVPIVEMDAGDESSCQATQDKEREKTALLKEIATEVICGVKTVLPTTNRFSILEHCTDLTAQSMNAASQSPVLSTIPEVQSTNPATTEEHPPFILVRSCGSSKRSSTNLKLRLEPVDSHQPMDATALLDTGATGLFIDEPYVEAKRFTRQKLPRSIPVYNIDGTLNEHGSVKECVDLIVRYGDHTERARFYVTQLGGDALVVGHPWLVQHNPEINWVTGEVKMTR